MSVDIPRPQGDVLRRNPERECGNPVGQISVLVKGFPDLQTISFYCNKPRLHTDECVFEGSQVTIRRKQRPIILNHP